MATSNTKLDSYEKEQLGFMKMRNPGVTIVNNGQTTVVFQLKGNTVQFATAVAAPEEKKFRRKVGEYNALNRYENGQYAVVEKYDFCAMLFEVFGMDDEGNAFSDLINPN